MLVRLSMKRLLVAALALAALGGVAFAQAPKPDEHHPDQAPPAAAAPAPGGMGMMGGDMPRMMSMMHGGGMMGGMPFRHVEGRLAFLKAELRITPAQEPYWTKFADAVRAAANTAKSAMPQMMQGATKASAPEVLGRYEKMLTLRLETVRPVRAAFDPLYAALSAEQKRVADELFASPMGVM
jgi:hypothetical protein